MKKTLLSVGAALAVIGSAAAVGPDTCNPDKYVWVEKDELCIPKNPCKSKSDVIRDAYCNRTFKDVQLSNWRRGIEVVKAYLSKQRGLGMIMDPKDYRDGVDTSLFGQDYIPAKTSDGGYIVFEFDDLSDIGGADVREGVAKAGCYIYSGRPWRFGGQDREFACKFVSESDCSEMAKIMTDLRDGLLVISDYKEYEAETVCNLTFEK